MGSAGADRSEEAWRQVYRSLEHGVVKNACQQTETISKFPNEIQDFANRFVTMQKKRHDADYDPSGTYFKSSVMAEIAQTEAAISDFKRTKIKDRRAFAAWVLLKARKS